MAEELIQFLQIWFILILFLLELGLKVVLNYSHQLGVVENQARYDEISNDQRGTALAVASLVFAGLAIVLSSNPGQFVTQIEIFGVAFGLLLVAAFAHELTLTYRIVLTIQEMSLEYGLLLMVFGLFLLVEEVVQAASQVLLIVFIIVLVFRFLSVVPEVSAHYNE